MSGLNKDEINRIIYDNGLFHGTMALGVVMDADHLERFVKLIVEAERERILDMCKEGLWDGEGIRFHLEKQGSDQ